MAKYPEHDKLRAVSDVSQQMGSFMEWLFDEGWEITKRNEWDDVTAAIHRFEIEKVLARFFEIDLSKIAAEKDAMLNELREANNG